MKKVVIIDERDFAKLATECNHIENAVSLAKDVMDEMEDKDKTLTCLQESLTSISRHIDAVQRILNKKDE